MTFGRTTRIAALALTAGLALTACGDDSSSDAAASASAAAPSAAPSASPSEEPMQSEPIQIDALSGQSTSVALDQGFVDALGTLGLTPAPVGEATLEGGAITFPITDGSVTYYDPTTNDTRPYVQGSILHAGSGLSLSAGDTTVELTDFTVDPGESVLTGAVAVNGEVAVESTPLFFLDGSTLEPLSSDDSTATLTGTTVKLDPGAAQLLRDTFMTEDVPDLLTIGVATIVLDLPAS